MMFMNEYEVADAAGRWADHPILGPATQTLANLVAATNRCSDGWAYWPKPCRAAAKLQDLIQGDRSHEARFGDREEVTAEHLKLAYRPLKAFRTRQGMAFELVEPAPTTPQHPCFGCQTPIDDTAGNYYCVACVARQAAEQAEECEAFVAFHDFADRCGR